MKGCIMSTYQVRMSTSRHLFSLVLILMLCGLSLLSLFALAARTTPHQIGALSAQGHWARWAGRQAPGFADCEAQFSVPCYTPQLYRNAYDATPILNSGYTG